MFLICNRFFLKKFSLDRSTDLGSKMILAIQRRGPPGSSETNFTKILYDPYCRTLITPYYNVYAYAVLERCSCSFAILRIKFYKLNPQAVGRDSRLHFILRNFLVNILRPTSFRMSTTSISGL